jgi:hypothetical protein
MKKKQIIGILREQEAGVKAAELMHDTIVANCATRAI